MVIYYSIEILYNSPAPGAEEHRHQVHDMTADALMKFREKIFTAGFYLLNKENIYSGEVIPPWRINRVFVHVQKTKYGNPKPAPAPVGDAATA